MSQALNALDAALEAQDPARLRAALGDASIAVLAAVVPAEGFGETTRIQVATAPDGQRHLIAFTGQDAALAFRPEGKVVMTPGRELAAVARHQTVDSVYFNPSGPSGTAVIATAALEQIMDGFDAPPAPGAPGLVGELSVLPAGFDVAPFVARLAALGPDAGDLEAYAFDRTGGAGRIPTLGIVADDARISRIAAELSSGHDLAVLDLVQLDRQTADELLAALPDSRLNLDVRS